jgi:hypothetical protein
MLKYRELAYEEIDADVAVFQCKLHTDSHSMITDSPFDLYTWMQKLSQADWVEEIYIFGSRRYPSNVSFGSDIDLLIVPNRFISGDIAAVLRPRFCYAGPSVPTVMIFKYLE